MSTFFGVLRQIRSIRHSLSIQACTTLVTCFIFRRQDYCCNVVFVGLFHCELDLLPSVKTSVVRPVAGTRTYDLVMPLLMEKH